MLRKMLDFPMKAYINTRNFVADFKRDERGLSGVVVAVLLILVAVLAVALIWGLLGEWLENVLWPRITGAVDF